MQRTTKDTTITKCILDLTSGGGSWFVLHRTGVSGA